jgi:hypothetical protein
MNMNSEVSSNTNAPAEPAIKAISDAADLHKKSFLELMDRIDGGDNIEFDTPTTNIILKPTIFD